MFPPHRHRKARTRQLRKKAIHVEHQHRRDDRAKTPAAIFHIHTVATRIQEHAAIFEIAEQLDLKIVAVRLRIHLLHERELAFAEAAEVPARVAAHDEQNLFDARRGTRTAEIVAPLPLALEHPLGPQRLQRAPHRARRSLESRAQVLYGRQRAIRRNLAGFPVVQQQTLQARTLALVNRNRNLGLAAPKVAVAVLRINLPLGDQALVRPENRERGRPRRRRHLAHRREPVPILEPRRFNPLAKILDSHGEPQKEQ